MSTKKKKKKANTSIKNQKKKKKKKANTLEAKSNVRGIFRNLFHEHPLPVFSLCFLPMLGRKLFGRPKEKTLFIFLLPHPTKHTLKKFSFLFSLQSFPFTLFHLYTNTLLYFEAKLLYIFSPHETQDCYLTDSYMILLCLRYVFQSSKLKIHSCFVESQIIL